MSKDYELPYTGEEVEAILRKGADLEALSNDEIDNIIGIDSGLPPGDSSSPALSPEEIDELITD